jgi:GNAT superfamily N-acetyltransferase
LNQVAELGAATYGGQVPLARLEYLNWKFHGNPYGTVAVVCEVDHRVVGCGALTHVPMRIEHVSYEGGIGADTMVHPDYRTQGIAGVVTYESLKYAGSAAIAYGIHNARSPTVVGLTKHMEFVVVGEVRYLKKYLSPLSALVNLRVSDRNFVRHLGYLAELAWITLAQTMTSITSTSGNRHASGADEGIVVRQASLRFEEEFDRLWEEVAPSLTVAVERRKEYLNWRYANPCGNYLVLRADLDGKLRGFCVLAYENREGLKTARIIDLLFATAEAGNALVDACIRRSRQDKAQVLKLYRNLLTEKLSRGLRLIKGWGRSTVIARCTGTNIPRDIVSDISNWFLTGADIEDGL